MFDDSDESLRDIQRRLRALGYEKEAFGKAPLPAPDMNDLVKRHARRYKHARLTGITDGEPVEDSIERARARYLSGGIDVWEFEDRVARALGLPVR